MRCYMPLSKSELALFVDSSHLHSILLFRPSQALALEYAVEEEEELEYAALELAREWAESAERAEKQIIVALELKDEFLVGGSEIRAGRVEGAFDISYDDVVALYLIHNADDELEWYDASESATCLAQI